MSRLKNITRAEWQCIGALALLVAFCAACIYATEMSYR